MKPFFASFRLSPLVAAAFIVSDSAHAAVLFDAPGHVAVEGTRVSASGGEPGAAWRLVDWRSRDTGVAGAFDEAGQAELPPLPTGYYRMVEDSKRTTASLATLAVVAPRLSGKARGASTGGAEGASTKGAEGASTGGAEGAST
ncbi:MAG: hypothetical protein IJK04_14830, partial [Kiritimatiellae bacterium]|nr:hypothetical protein [Kiritimatiellia bacterium]